VLKANQNGELVTYVRDVRERKVGGIGRVIRQTADIQHTQTDRQTDRRDGIYAASNEHGDRDEREGRFEGTGRLGGGGA
jgi:hypothetical protein